MVPGATTPGPTIAGSTSAGPSSGGPMAAVTLRGRSASPGFAVGPLHLLKDAAALSRSAGSPREERSALAGALLGAAEALGLAGASLGGEAADIIAFQIAMLEDEALSEGAFHAIEAGIPADQAWRGALDAEIAGYEAADDETFRARASDLVDIRDRVLRKLAGQDEGAGTIAPGAVVYADDLPPSRFVAADWRGGAILLAAGSASSHVATLARARGVPMIVALSALPGGVGEGDEALVDGAAGTVELGASAMAKAQFETRRAASAEAGRRAAAFLRRPAATADGAPISVLVNVAGPGDLTDLDPSHCDGIGLVRTELLFERGALADEAAQTETYRAMLRWAGGRPVTVRTLDAGGDKPIPGITRDGESNPFLGVRGLRLSFLNGALFRAQLRALARAAADGPLDVMLPMVSVPGELARARAMLDEECEALGAAGVRHRRPALGIMVEVPAAAIAVDRFDAAFFSIGSNDLTQYVMAAGRDNAGVADLADAADEAVLRLIERVASHGAATGRKVSICGDAAGDPRIIPHLLRRGLRTLSVAPAALAGAKEAISAVWLDRPHA